ncbi:MAG: HlyD family efflux transporter periplasmic adaptor subunit [Planctomycetota bacterium]|nr:MAG: HlyD family efflux transporter periplasmic adaptor subunit [Planctomycetota bacterium]
MSPTRERAISEERFAMKKWLALAAVLAVIVGGWYFVRTNVRFTPLWAQPKFGVVSRSDIRVPITAAGLIEPEQRIEIKSEASGEVIEINYVEGDAVKKGDVLVVLNPDDERRSVTRAEAALERANALAAQAEVAVEKARANILAAQARVDELVAQGESIQADLEHTEWLAENGDVAEKQLIDARSRAAVNKAQLAAAQANLQVAQYNLTDAEQAVIIQHAAVKEATKTLEDARERLRETEIRSPADAIVTEVRVQVGSLVQSATTSVTGGTPVMTLADITTLKVVTRVDEADYGKVHNISPLDALPEIEELRRAAMENAEQMKKRTGKVTLTVDAFPEDEFEGVIQRVEPQGKLNTGSSIIQYDVHVRITDERRYMLPLGAQAQVEFTVESVRDALTVPAEAVKTFESERGVWVPDKTQISPDHPYGKPRFVRCRFGITDGTHTQVLEVIDSFDLKEGVKVFTKLPPKPDDRG